VPERVAVEKASRWHLGRVFDPCGHHREIGHPLARMNTDKNLLKKAGGEESRTEREKDLD
jgi:hypothetical protein